MYVYNNYTTCVIHSTSYTGMHACIHYVTHAGVTPWKATNTGYNAEQYPAGGMYVCVYLVASLLILYNYVYAP